MEEKTMTTKEIFEKAAADVELAGKFQKAKTPEESYEIAKEAGLTDSFEAFVAAAKEAKDAEEKLNPGEIDAVVGGASDTITTLTTTTSVTAAASAAVI